MSPPLIDERRIKHEESLAGDRGEESQRPLQPQFTPRGVLAFLVTITVAASLAVAGMSVQRVEGELLVTLAAVLAWLALFVAYRRLHLRVAGTVHWAGLPVSAVAVLLVESDALRAVAEVDLAWLLFDLAAAVRYGCILSSTLSVPACAATLAVWPPKTNEEGRKTHSAGAQDRPQRHHPPQFTLKDLFAFLTVFAFCLSLGATGFKLPGPGPLRAAFMGAAAVVMWVLLLGMYHKFQCRVALFFHVFGLAVLVCAGFVLGVFVAAPLFLAFPVGMCCGCALGSVLSLPVFAVTMAVSLKRTGIPLSDIPE